MAAYSSDSSCTTHLVTVVALVALLSLPQMHVSEAANARMHAPFLSSPYDTLQNTLVIGPAINFTLQWTAYYPSATLLACISAAGRKSSDWIGLGFSEQAHNQMNASDIVVGEHGGGGSSCSTLSFVGGFGCCGLFLRSFDKESVFERRDRSDGTYGSNDLMHMAEIGFLLILLFSSSYLPPPSDFNTICLW